MQVYSKLLQIDLDKETFDSTVPGEKVLRKFLGGAGLGAKILWDETTEATDPLSSKSILLFMLGPLTGLIPASSRYVVMGLSPLTGILGQAHSGGDWGWKLRHAGFDGVIVRGRASRPLYLWIHNGEVEIRDASLVWGRDTYETSDALQKETHEGASVLAIGQAGERLVNVACVMNDGKRGRAAARCGLGALMGSKNLKAIVVRGTMKVPVCDEEGLRRFVKGAQKKFVPYPIGERPEETKKVEYYVNSFKGLIDRGAPIKNWTRGTSVLGYSLAEEVAKTQKSDFCMGCPSSCSESRLTKDGERHMVWEFIGPLGLNCLIGDAEILQRTFSLCQRYGLDTISTGNIIAYAMELMEKGIITTSDTEGLDLTWGNGQAAFEMVEQIGKRTGFGEILGMGVKKVSERLGGRALEYALHVKGLEMPAHDPRSSYSLALHYSVCNLGASHFAEGGCFAYLLDGYERGFYNLDSIPELGIMAKVLRDEEKGKGEYLVKLQNFGCMIDSLSLCSNVHRGKIQPSGYAEMLRYATGWDIDKEEFLLTGERIFNLKRMFNVRRGISRKDDFLPLRFLTHPRGDGDSANMLPHLGLMLNEYYSHRGWSEEGVPTKGKLIELGLDECLKYGM